MNGRLQFGYPYPQLSLLLIVPAHLLGDLRYPPLAPNIMHCVTFRVPAAEP